MSPFASPWQHHGPEHGLTCFVQEHRHEHCHGLSGLYEMPAGWRLVCSLVCRHMLGIFHVRLGVVSEAGKGKRHWDVLCYFISCVAHACMLLIPVLTLSPSLRLMRFPDQGGIREPFPCRLHRLVGHPKPKSRETQAYSAIPHRFPPW